MCKKSKFCLLQCLPFSPSPSLSLSLFLSLSLPLPPLRCWLEGSIFPNTFTYLFAFTSFIVMATLLVSLVLLVCSDYSVEVSMYLQLGAMAINALFFFLSILLTFFTASAQQYNINGDAMLVATSISVLTTGAVFFVCFGLLRPKIRTAMFCQWEREKAPSYENFQDEMENTQQRRRSSALSIILRGRKRPQVQLNKDTDINYVDDYLGFTHSSFTMATPVPLAMLGQVQRQGRVRRTNELHVGGVAHGAWPQHRPVDTSEA